MKKLIFMIPGEGKTPDELAKEAWAAFEKYKEEQKKEVSDRKTQINEK